MKLHKSGAGRGGLTCVPTLMWGLSKIAPTALIRLLVVMELWLLLSDHRRPPVPPPALLYVLAAVRCLTATAKREQ